MGRLTQTLGLSGYGILLAAPRFGEYTYYPILAVKISMQIEPIDPFERWTGRQNDFDERRIFRPLHYTFAQHHLPNIFFSDRDIGAVFSSNTDESSLMCKLWEWCASECMRMGLWHPAFVNRESTMYKEYVHSMATRSSRQLHSVADYHVCLFVMPHAISALESIFIALCRPMDSDSTDANLQSNRRYITLESTYSDSATMLCEKSPDGSHHTLSQDVLFAPDEFIDLLRKTIGRAEA
jgi:hypothetical protein